MVERPDPYNPLARVNLGRSVENALLEQSAVALAPSEPFVGVGVYAIYYTGDFPAYRPIAQGDLSVPIYVGKAVPAGARQGKFGLNADPGRALHKRLRDHQKSVDQAENLDLKEFRCRYLVVEDIWIPLGESLLIAHFKPVWNQALDGFGIHDPGAGRHGSRRSDWDELHPGRPWYSRMRAETTAAELDKQVAAHLEAHPPRGPEQVPPPQDDEVPAASEVAD